MNDVWRKLDIELQKWEEASISPIFWIRDDDASKDGPKLAKLISISKKFSVPISIAVIPFLIEKSLIKTLNSNDLISVLQHGFKHKNYEPDGEKKSEFGKSREINHMIDDIIQGSKLVAESFEKSYEPIFVPPWNRMSHLLLPHIQSIGLAAVSSFSKNLSGYRNFYNHSKIINTHIDIIDWKSNKIFLGEKRILNQLILELVGRRNKKIKGNYPIGILTHHKVMEDNSFLFLETLINKTQNSGATWKSIQKIIQ